MSQPPIPLVSVPAVAISHTRSFDIADNTSGSVVHELDADLCDAASGAWDDSFVSHKSIDHSHLVRDQNTEMCWAP